jgi:hypothetical protein
MVGKSEKGLRLLVHHFKAVMPDIRNPRFGILADNDSSRDVTSAIVKAIFANWQFRSIDCISSRKAPPNPMMIPPSTWARKRSPESTFVFT